VQATAPVLLASLNPKEVAMLFCNKVQASKIENAPAQAGSQTVDAGKIVLGGGFRLPVRTADTGTIRLASTDRSPFG